MRTITIPHTSFVVVFCAFIVDIVASQQSTTCTFRNGTLGNKCVGPYACFDVEDITKISCGSCIGDQSCRGVSPFTTVGEESCIGYQACVNGKPDRAHYVCFEMTRTNIYLIKVEIMSGTIPAVEIVLAIVLLVSQIV